MPRHAAALLFAVLLAVAGIVTATASMLHSGPTPVPPGGPTEPAFTVTAAVPVADPEVDLGDPVKVCEAFAAALLTTDTATDAGPADPYRRAATYATPELAAPLVAAPARWSPDWEELVANRGGVTAEIESYAGEAPPGRAGTAHHAAVVTTTATGPGGWTGRSSRYTVYCTLTQTGPQWQIAGYDLERQRLP